MKRVVLIYLLFIGAVSFCQSNSEIDSASQIKPATDTCYVIFNWNSARLNKFEEPGSLVSDETDSLETIFLIHVLDCSGESCSFNIQPECPVSNYKVRIYNRWGEILFESTNAGDVWCPYGHDEGVYIWQAEGTYTNGETFKRRGHVTLLYDPRRE